MRYVKTIGMLLLLLIGYGLSLLPLLLVWPHIQFQYLLPALIVWAALYVLPLPFFLRIIIRKVWFFHGRGEPVIKDLLEFLIMGINDFNTPAMVRQKRNHFILSWRCKEPEWCQRMALEGVKKSYELNLELDSNTRTVIMRDRVRDVNFSLCPLRVTTSLLTSGRFYCRVRTGSDWGIKNFEHTAACDYYFNPHELKSPVFNTIIANGWHVRFDLY